MKEHSSYSWKRGGEHTGPLAYPWKAGESPAALKRSGTWSARASVENAYRLSGIALLSEGAAPVAGLIRPHPLATSRGWVRGRRQHPAGSVAWLLLHAALSGEHD